MHDINRIKGIMSIYIRTFILLYTNLAHYCGASVLQVILMQLNESAHMHAFWCRNTSTYLMPHI